MLSQLPARVINARCVVPKCRYVVPKYPDVVPKCCNVVPLFYCIFSKINQLIRSGTTGTTFFHRLYARLIAFRVVVLRQQKAVHSQARPFQVF